MAELSKVLFFPYFSGWSRQQFTSHSRWMDVGNKAAARLGLAKLLEHVNIKKIFKVKFKKCIFLITGDIQL